jgi:hypothetical protein
MTWAVAAVLGLAMAFPGQMAGQGNQALRPTDSDLYCAGYFTQGPVDTSMTILGSEDGGLKNEFVDHDIIYLTRGQGAAPGTEFMVVREVRDLNPRESFPGQKKMLMSLGTLYAEVARIQIRVANEGSLTAEVTHACDPALAGDLVVPLRQRSAPAYRMPKLVDRFAPSSGKPTGMVVAAKEWAQSLGEGQIVYLNVGSLQGAQVGTYMRVFRTATARSQDPFEAASREYMTVGMGDQRVGRKLTPADVASLPRNVLGEVMVISVEEGSSTGIITFSREEITIGDMVEIE